MTLEEAWEVFLKATPIAKTSGKSFNTGKKMAIPVGIRRIKNGDYVFALNNSQIIQIELCKVYVESEDPPIVKPKKSGMTRIQSFTIEEIFSLLPSPYPKTEVNGRMLKLQSDRILTFFYKGITCVTCGIAGSIFWYEDPGNSEPHLNFYAEVGDKLVLMTKDHIIPKSRGGKDRLSNYQTMCTLCNCAKGNKLPEEIEDVKEPNGLCGIDCNPTEDGVSGEELANAAEESSGVVIRHSEEPS